MNARISEPSTVVWYFLYVPKKSEVPPRELPLPVMAWALGLPSAGGRKDDVVKSIQAEHQKVFFCVFFPAISDDVFLKVISPALLELVFFVFFTISKWNLSWNGFILRISDVYRKY